MKVERIQDIDAIVSKKDSNIAVVVLHGYGATYQDFVPFSDIVIKDKNPSWYFLNGITPVVMGPYESGRCWFPIDMMGLERALNNGTFSDFFKGHIPEGIEEARTKVKNVLQNLRTEYDQIYLGGFSQGSMVSADIAFHNPELVDKLFLLSSTMVAESVWSKVCQNKLPFKIFQSHGTVDPVLPIQGARELKSFLEGSDNTPKYLEFSGAHEVPPVVVNELDQFLRES
ncbi:alpha/beta hydrolase [Halobacteriovorax sp.]|uniref:alpha/beta hydrolase n=1 Tax=Halobacteriovorax sp. TaxID=2020862 RepID=UPI0035682D5E